MVYQFDELPMEEKKKYINNTATSLINRMKEVFGVEVNIKLVASQLHDLEKQKNLREIKRKIEDIVFSEFFKSYKG